MDIEGDTFGKIYEYFLGKFAMSEGQKGGEFFTPTSIRLLRGQDGCLARCLTGSPATTRRTGCRCEDGRSPTSASRADSAGRLILNSTSTIRQLRTAEPCKRPGSDRHRLPADPAECQGRLQPGTWYSAVVVTIGPRPVTSGETLSARGNRQETARQKAFLACEACVAGQLAFTLCSGI